MTNWKIFGICAAIGFAICMSMFIGYRTYISHKANQKQVLMHQADMRMQERVAKSLWGKVCHYAPVEYNEAVAKGTLGKYPGEVIQENNQANQASIK